MKRFYVLCAVLALVLSALTMQYRSESDTFYGIADTTEIVISSGSPVEIRRILVAQGQLVGRGDTLLELHNPELELRISQISHELNELRARKSAHASLSKSELLQLKAQHEERASEIRAEIQELEAQYELNRNLVSELRSLDGDQSASGIVDHQNPILVKLESLRKLLKLAQDPSRVYETRLASALSTDGDPLTEQVARLEDELRILLEGRRGMLIRAQISGLIGSVNFKAGEKVSPFKPILTLHAVSPSLVRGYIHENVYSQVSVGEKVTVKSNQDGRQKVEGEVVGVGARIVEYPERLRKRADILIWGREIIIRLPPENRFLMGEKVVISLPKNRGATAAREAVPPAPDAPPAPAIPENAPEIPAGLEDIQAARTATASMAGQSSPSAGVKSELEGIEASGLVFLPDLDRFLVISDDTEKKRPILFLMNASARIGKTVTVQGLDKMDDMEAISVDGKGALWILSSQSRTKKGKLPDHRKLLVKAKRDGEKIELAGKALLHDLLRKAAQGNPDEPWASFLHMGFEGEGIDIEGMTVRNDGLYLGFKAPLLDGKAVILRLPDPEALLQGTVPGRKDIAIWKLLDLKDERTGTACGLADLHSVGGDLYLISTGTAAGQGHEDGRHAGELWVLRTGAERPERLKDFGGAKPEGVAMHPASGSLYVVFDNGSGKPSQVMKVEAER
jgi:multidrug resistance efflux pump